ncbi:uncharacterized protein EAE97_004221 [Botrytis byssoidea]|uniref:NmrA-like domain-containing protein n=1 Tax=Botrytis byssoidea TaxID=139641 RepID=A0A9P5IM84_9HELO|nr:uncharacterized protein EAE97_004221 [Botrytis byssoidea]KAF7946972.1 hypothetical protein EAE97_004221 [Botrytis byssoidea]
MAAQANKTAIIGHRGWAAGPIVEALATASVQPIRILYRAGSPVGNMPKNVELAEYSWDQESSLETALRGVDILISLIGHDGLHMQQKLIQPMKAAAVKLFAPSDLALPYTAEESATVAVPREKKELKHALHDAGIPTVTVVIGNFTAFALQSPYIGIDVPQNRIVFTGNSKTQPVYLCSRKYVAAGYASIFVYNSPTSLSGRTIGLNELHPTGAEIAAAMEERAGRPPQTAEESIENMRLQALEGNLAALVRKKMGEGTHDVGSDIWDVAGYPKTTIRELIVDGKLDEEQSYIQPSEDTLHLLDKYFA